MGKSSNKGKKKSNRMHPDDWSHQGDGDGDGDYSYSSVVGFLHPESDLEGSSNQWMKERSSQQMELDELNHRDDDDAGCCAVVMDRVIMCLHVLDLSFGISLLVYGSLMHTDTHNFDVSAASSSASSEEESRAMAAISFCYIFGTIHLLTSVLGLYSRYVSTKCKRCGMYVSAYAGMYFAFAYYTIVIALLIDTKGFLTYLDDHKEVMYFKSNVYEKTERMMPLIYSILIVLGSLEAMRLCILLGLRGRLVRHDAYEPRTIPRRSSLSDANNNGGSLTEALLEQQPSATNNPFEDDIDDIGESGTVATGGGSVRSGRSGRSGGAARMETADTPKWWEKDIV